MIEKVRCFEQRDNTSLMEQDIGGGATMQPSTEDGKVWTQEFGLSEYKDQQRIVIQEAPENAPTGHIPTSVEAIIEQDLVDKVKPGDRVRVIGVYRAFPKVNNNLTNGVFPMRIIANNLLQIRGQVLSTKVLAPDVKQIKNVAA